MMDGDEILAVHLGAHLDTDIVLRVDIPGGGMAHHFAVKRLGDLRPFPEGLRQGRQAERAVETLADLHHFNRIVAARLQLLANVIAEVACPLGRDDIIDIAPALRPHIAEQIGADRPVGGLHRLAIFLIQPVAGIAMQRIVKRLHLPPEAIHHFREFIGGHVIFGTPHRAGIGIAQFLRALVGDIDHAGIILPHRRAHAVVPARPHLLKQGGIALRAHRLLDI